MTDEMVWQQIKGNELVGFEAGQTVRLSDGSTYLLIAAPRETVQTSATPRRGERPSVVITCDVAELASQLVIGRGEDVEIGVPRPVAILMDAIEDAEKEAGV